METTAPEKDKRDPAGSAVDLSVTLGPDGRSVILTGTSIAAGSNYALHFEGLRDMSGYALQPENRMLSVANLESFEVIADTAAPVLLAVMDGNDGIYLLFDEEVQSVDMASAIQLKRQGSLVEGETLRVHPRALKWRPTGTDLGGGFFLGAQYALSVVGVEDLAGNPADESAMSFTHLAGDEGQLLIARQAATETIPMAASAYGLTSLFQGRTWHSDLGLYYYRARWYLPEGGVFGERDPLGYEDSPDLLQALGFDALNFFDPKGRALYAFDGTWNTPKDETNVWILANAYVGRSLYQKGVGTGGVLDKAVGGASGWGTRRRVNAAFLRFRQNWAKGDKTIDIIGFSRGAAAARAFAKKIFVYAKPALGISEPPPISSHPDWVVFGGYRSGMSRSTSRQ